MSLKMIQRAILWAILVYVLSLNACASLYFQEKKPPAGSLQITSLEALPWREIWYGFVFNGEKVGFTHLKITKDAEKQDYRISSKAYLRIRFLGLDKKITMISEDVVHPDLSIVSFQYDQQMDDRPLRIEGKMADGRFRAVQKFGNETKIIDEPSSGRLYPASAINLYPVLQGMQVGSQYRFIVFDPQTQSFEEVLQTVAAFEESPKLSVEPSYRIETRMHSQSVSTWINPQGKTLLELAMNGVLITYREEEAQAKKFLTEASLNKKDLIFDFSLVRTDKPLACPRESTSMKIVLTGIAGELPLLQGPGQDTILEMIEGKSLAVFNLHAGGPVPPILTKPPLEESYRRIYLASTHHIESDHPEIKKTAAEILAGARDAPEQVRRLTVWVATAVKNEAVDSFSALDVLHSRKGECQAHTLLYTALARAAGIPTKLTGGLVYLEGVGFLYHSWAESYADGWIAVDPTFNQVGLDATHIKLVEGPSWTSTLPLGTVVGKIRARIIDYQTACHP
jgi:hypothetical protein